MSECMIDKRDIVDEVFSCVAGGFRLVDLKADARILPNRWTVEVDLKREDIPASGRRGVG